MQRCGVPPQAAFYAAPVGLILYAIFGTSRQLVVAVSSAVAVMSASVVAGLAPAGSEEFITFTAALAVMAGVVAVLAGLLKLGRIAQFFSEPVLTGFVSGLALVIMIKQVPKLFGLEASEGSFWARVVDLISELSNTHLLSLAIGLSAVVLMLFIEHRFKRIPAALVVMIYGIVVVSAFNLEAQHVEIIGAIRAGLVPPKVPDISLTDLARPIPGGLAITLVVFSEAIGPARSFAHKHRHEIDEDQELIGLGMANIGVGLFQGFPIGASLSKSAANDAAGGRSQVSGLVAAIATALVALFLTSLLTNLPEAALGAIVIVAVSGMSKPQEFRRLYRLRKGDFLLAAVTFLAVLTFDEVLVGPFIGVVVSLLALVIRTSSPRFSILGRLPGTAAYRSVENYPDVIQSPEILIFRPDEGIFFANAATLSKAIRASVSSADPALEATILDLSLTNDLDAPSVEMLAALHEELVGQDVQLMLASVQKPVMDMLERSGLSEQIGAQNMHASVLEATLSYAQAHLDEITSEEVDTVIDRLDMFTQFISVASDKASPEQKIKLGRAVDTFADMREKIDAAAKSESEESSGQ